MPKKQNGRTPLHAEILDSAHDSLHEFADEEGCSVTALIETFASDLDSEYARGLAGCARRTTALRRRRRP